ncbi:hypothetical protein FZC76_06895 [Sutcliffiella horikoshii]|uniref:Uncharacterized protein n=1 Tax=Sutcliffiella horikoshii TaxID=79883 RepID=A0A5D4SYY8_9BACI|nr:hypothetical protein [Sutcliffiella horikoshii]TYS68667.1 hypothetical protein FZC76_06895 [Sutcliffiella horikoshii]
MLCGNIITIISFFLILLLVICCVGKGGSLHHSKAKGTLRLIQGICMKCNGVIDRDRVVGDKPTARIYCKKCLGK